MALRIYSKLFYFTGSLLETTVTSVDPKTQTDDKVKVSVWQTNCKNSVNNLNRQQSHQQNQQQPQDGSCENRRALGVLHNVMKVNSKLDNLVSNEMFSKSSIKHVKNNSKDLSFNSFYCQCKHHTTK